ncbi:MAG: GNAT family N-acetyltransferase [bacterium]|nr:GNAT family N-acetyltransferase [bacterium]
MESSPDWCFVAEENGKFTGRVVYWTFPSSPGEIKITGLQLPWDEDFLTVGKELLLESLKQMKSKGGRKLEVRSYSGSTPFIEKRSELYTQIGLKLEQEKQAYTLENDFKSIDIPDRLNFRTLGEVGVKSFTEAIKMVTNGTLDREDSLEVKDLGADQAATNYFNILKDIDYNQARWNLAYNSENKLIGLIVPQKFTDETGAINYIGVLPEYRGKGYVNDLLAKGTSILKTEGIKQIIADIDVKNTPLAKALSRAEYKESKRIWLYGMDLNRQS